MDYKVTIKETPDYLLLTCTGVVKGFKNLQEYSGYSIQQAMERGVKKVVIDERNVLITISDLEQLELMNFFMTSVPRSLDMKFSVIFSEQNRDVAKLFENLSAKVNFDCKFFLSEKEAIENIKKA